MRRVIKTLVRVLALLGAGAAAAIMASAGWVAYVSAGRVHDVADAPDAPTVIVLGSQVRDGKPMGFLAGRLDAAIELMRSGKAQTVLVSGDANGGSGDEIAAMTDYLVAAGIDPDLERHLVAQGAEERTIQIL